MIWGMQVKATENFRINLKREIDDRGVSQVSVAESAAISSVYLSMIIHGKAAPSLDVCDRIADALKVPVETLLKPQKKVANST